MTTTTISRRTLAKGAAWATPVIVASTIVPAYAASACKPEEFALTTHAYYRNDSLRLWQITLRGSAGKTLSPGDTLVLDFEGLKLDPGSESSWSLSSDGKTATYIGPETGQAILTFILDYELPHPYTNDEEFSGLNNAQRLENKEAIQQANDKVSSKITDEGFGKNWNFVPANSAKCFEFLGGTVERAEDVVEIDYE